MNRRLSFAALAVALASASIAFSAAAQTTSPILLADIDPNGGNSRAGSFIRFGARVAFHAINPVSSQRDVWITDGSAIGTRRLPGLPVTSFSEPRLAVVGDELWAVHGGGVFATDGGTSPWRRIANVSGDVSAVAGVGPKLVYVGNATVSSLDRFGNVAVVVQAAGLAQPAFVEIVEAGAQVWVVWSAPNGRPVGGTDVYVARTDGTAGGSVFVGSVRVPGSMRPTGAVAYRDRLYVSGQVGSSDVAVVASSVSVQQDPFLASQSFHVAGDRLFGVQRSGRIVAGDGTPAGSNVYTHPIGIIDARAFADRLLFRPLDNAVHATDGTLTGTVAIGVDGYTGLTGRTFVRVEPDRAMLYGIRNGSLDLFVTDGTPGGTASVVSGIRPSNFGGFGGTARTLNGAVYVYANWSGATVSYEPYAIPVGAVAEKAAPDCGSSVVREARLRAASRPQFGQTLRLEGRSAGGLAALLVVGLPAPRPRPIPSTTCALHFDGAGLATAGPLPLDAAGRFQLGLPVPASASLLGIDLVAQSLFIHGTSPIDLEISGALWLVVGI